MIDTDALRKKVIDLAIQGKLTEQLPSDGDAETLYAQIQEEKGRLVKEGKIKKDKALPDISADEIPFEIPKNWKWVHMGDIFDHNTGKALNNSDKEGKKLEYITTSNMYWDHFELNSLKSMFFKESEIEKCTIKKGDLLICEGGDIGRSAIWCFDYEMRIQNHIHKLRGYGGIDHRFYFYIMRNYKDSGMIDGRGIGLQGFSSKRVHSLVVPLAPLAEQKRIAEKLEELFVEIDIIDDLQSKYSNDLAVLKNKIIDAGIQGKLTEQLPEDGTAEELYAQIQEEKAKLVKEGKIKKEKPLPEITDDEIPYEIPNNWKWVRFADVIKTDLGGGTPSKSISEYWDNGEIPWVTVKDFSNAKSGYIMDTVDHITEEGLNNSSTNLIDEKAIVICMRMALGKIVRLSKSMAINQDLRAVWLHNGIDERFFIYVYSTIRIKGRGMTVAGIRRDELRSFLIPLPPYNEQIRISKVIDEALNMIR